MAREFVQIVENNRIQCTWHEEEKQWYVPDAARIQNSFGTVNRQGYATKRVLQGSELSADELQRSQAASQRLVEARSRLLRETQRHVPDAVDTPHCEAGVEDQPVQGTARDVIGGEIQRTVCGATPIQRPRSQLCFVGIVESFSVRKLHEFSTGAFVEASLEGCCYLFSVLRSPELCSGDPSKTPTWPRSSRGWASAFA